jgi:chorismate mutase
MTILKPDTLLEDIRREIDAIDDALLDLVIRRFGATGKVRATKKSDGSLAASPLRPAREAMMLRRLMDHGKGQISPELLVRIWRVLLSASTQAQAPIVLHADPVLACDLASRLSIAEHFCSMKVEVHKDIPDAFEALHSRRGDLAIVQTASRWADCFHTSAAHGVQAIGALPVIDRNSPPQLLVFGHAEAQPSGSDETIVVSRNEFPQSVLRRWQVQSGAWVVTSISGFLSADTAPLLKLIKSGEAVQIAGRYPCSLEVIS